METLILIIAGMILAETTYLAYRHFRTSAGRSGDILLDTSVLIDGRIDPIARSGLITSRLLVPRSVVRELQFMADKADHDKRERARFGLENIEKLQQMPGLTTVIIDDGLTSEHGVDEQLILLAQKTGARLCTIDYNLNKAARVQGVTIVNINELAHALRVAHLPGETIGLTLLQAGQDKKQAVGYLDDGTMVVVDDARDKIGKVVDVTLTRVLQTAAGRMMFARLVSDPVPAAKPQPARSGRSGPSEGKRTSPASTAHAAKQNPSSRRKNGSDRKNPTSRRRRVSPEESMVRLANDGR